MKDATSQRAQAAAAAAEEVDEEDYGYDEEEDEAEDARGEAEEEVEAWPPKSALKSPKKRAAFIITGLPKGGQRAISARPTQREQRTLTSTTLRHN